MKKLYIIPALAAFIATGSFAHAAALDDLVLGFQNTANTTNLEIDIGNISTYFNTSQNGGTFVVGNIGSVLSAYEADWASSTALNWGVAGSTGALNGGPDGEPIKTNWITRQVNSGTETLGIQDSTSPSSVSSAASGTGSTNIQKSYAGINSTATAGGTGTNFASYTIAIGDANSWNNALTGGSSAFGVYATKLLFNNQTGNLVTGGTYSASDFFQMGTTTGTPGQYLGTFAIAQDGTLSFTKFVAIPEPSVYAAILGAACLGFVAIRRRKQQVLA